jgi:hypothetical protein
MERLEYDKISGRFVLIKMPDSLKEKISKMKSGEKARFAVSHLLRREIKKELREMGVRFTDNRCGGQVTFTITVS